MVVAQEEGTPGVDILKEAVAQTGQTHTDKAMADLQNSLSRVEVVEENAFATGSR